MAAEASDEEAVGPTEGVCNGSVAKADQDGPEEADKPTDEVVAVPKSHPLKYTWTYWYLNDQRTQSWERRLKKVSSFKTLEEFWTLHLNIRPPSLLPSSCDYNVFKEGIQPMWEVQENAKGGRWLITFDKVRQSDLIDLVWLEVLMAVIGEKFGKCTEDICGIVVNIRNKGSKVSIWTRDAGDDETNRKIGQILKKVLMSLDADPKLQRPCDVLRYEDHQEVQNKNSSSVKPKFSLAMSD